MSFSFWIAFFIFLFFVICLVVLGMRAYFVNSCKRKEVLNTCQNIEPSETIFVSIPSYRDPELSKTIVDLFTQASCPFRIVVGVCNQNNNDLRESFKNTNVPFTNDFGRFLSTNMRVENVPYEKAKGPAIARASIEKKLYNGEKYYMMIDSHMRFMPEWDRVAIENLQACPSPRSIITMYPSGYNRHNSDVTFDPEEKVTFLKAKGNTDRGFITLEGSPFSTKPIRPLPQLFWTPCFSFTYAVAHLEVPYDYHLRNLFLGEEILMSARLWTSGWDFYTPMKMIVKHLWDRNYRPTFWELRGDSTTAEQRGQVLLGIRPPNSVHEKVTKNLEKFSLGQNRSLADYENFVDCKFDKALIGPRATLGLSPDYPQDEKLAKHGQL